MEDATWWACFANADHGLQRTNADKQRAVKTALPHPRGVTMSDSEIARHVRVSDKTVARYRRELEATSEIPKSTARIGADGRQIETAKIGSGTSGTDATDSVVPFPSHAPATSKDLTSEDIASFLREQAAIFGSGEVLGRLYELAMGLEESSDTDRGSLTDLQVAQPWTEPIEL